MTFICPIQNAAVTPWHAIAHLGLTAVVLVAGTILLTWAVVVYRRSDPRRAERARVAAFGDGAPRESLQTPTRTFDAPPA